MTRNGRVPWLTPIEEQKYLDDMVWKRETHKSHGTKLLETYSYLSSEGKLLDYLDSLLKKNGVKYHEPNFRDIFEKIYDFELVAESGLFQVGKNGSLKYLASPETPISFMTVHKSKGLEADNVVLLNFQNATLGFPNKIADDPILRLVLTAPEDYPYAEERRLLYVAMTRTKNRVFILTDSKRPSEFFKEFTPSQSVFILANGNTTQEHVKCPRCKTGTLLVRKNDESNRYFVGCSNYPQCDYKVQDTSALTTQHICPACGGFMVKRRGKFGQFYGCTNYPTCQHTEQINKSSV